MANRSAQRKLLTAARDGKGPEAYNKAVAAGADINYPYFYRYGRNAYFTYTADVRDADRAAEVHARSSQDVGQMDIYKARARAARGAAFERLWFVAPACKPSDGDTLLHIAVRLQMEDVIRWFKERGGDTSLSNKRGQTAYGAAEELGGTHFQLYRRVFELPCKRTCLRAIAHSLNYIQYGWRGLLHQVLRDH